jgi:hypothetical protein
MLAVLRVTANIDGIGGNLWGVDHSIRFLLQHRFSEGRLYVRNLPDPGTIRLQLGQSRDCTFMISAVSGQGSNRRRPIRRRQGMGRHSTVDRILKANHRSEQMCSGDPTLWETRSANMKNRFAIKSNNFSYERSIKLSWHLRIS